MIFQNAGSSFCPIRTVGDQLLEEMKEHRKIKKAEFEDEAVEMLAKFGFQDPKRILKSYPFELSGGIAAACRRCGSDALKTEDPACG